MSDWLVYAAYRTGAGMVGVLPGRVVRRLGSFAGWLSWMWAGPRKRMAIRHMHRVLGPDARAKRAARGMFAAYGRYWAEVLWYRPSRYDAISDRVRIDGLEHLYGAIDAGRPVILTIPHIGNWEMAATAAKRVGVQVTAVAEALANRRVTEWFLNLRASLGIDIILTDEGTGTMRRLLEALRAGKTVALLNDRDLSGRGVSVMFFGEETTLPAGPAALAIRTDAAILPVASYFDVGPGHHIVIEPAVPLPAAGTAEERVKAITTSLAEVLERQVLRHPSQWHLVQPNWPSDHGEGA